MRNARDTQAICFLLLCLSATVGRAQDAGSATLEGNTVTTDRHTLTVGANALLEQVVIHPAAAELPLELRGQGKQVSDEVMVRIGRGPQLREPMQLILRTEGQVTAFKAASPAACEQKADTVTATASGALGNLKVSITSVYTATGRIDMDIELDGKQAQLEEVVLEVKPDGPFDTLIAGEPLVSEPGVYDPRAFRLSGDPGTVWANVGDDVHEGARRIPGIVPYAFLGNGDRGFSWTVRNAEDWPVDTKRPSMVISRDDSGFLTWQMSLINTPTAINGVRRFSFSLQVHPATERPSDRRRLGWLEWPFTPEQTGQAGPEPKDGLVRADWATRREAECGFSALVGPAGANGLSAEKDLAATFPVTLFRYLAGTHTGLTARLFPNSVELIRPGMNPAADRMALGRALLHDIGLDAAGLAHLQDAAVVVKAMHEFGLFKDDGKTEFIPYWRSGTVLRYGPEFSAQDAFAVTADDPLSQVYFSAWRRPLGDGRYATLIIGVNESSEATREQLYILDRQYLFGKQNVITAPAVIAKWPMPGIPEESDWRRKKLQGNFSRKGDTQTVLLDMEDHGFVRQASVSSEMAVYGPLFIPARSYRFLYGAGRFK